MRVVRWLGIPLAVAAACTPGSSDDAAVDEINGGRTTRAHPAVGVVHLSVAQSFCTGTLIAPDVVLTAAHCLEAGEKADAFFTGAGKATTETVVDPATLGMVRHAVAEQVMFPEFDYFYVCPNPVLDIALLRLETPITDVAPVALGPSARTGEACTIVGFGVHEKDGGPETSLQKRAATVTIATVRESSVDVAWATGLPRHGDSGGPLLCGGALVGVTSCEPDYPPDVIAYSHLTAGLPWVRAMLARWDVRTRDDGGVP